MVYSQTILVKIGCIGCNSVSTARHLPSEEHLEWSCREYRSTHFMHITFFLSFWFSRLLNKIVLKRHENYQSLSLLIIKWGFPSSWTSSCT